MIQRKSLFWFVTAVNLLIVTPTVFAYGGGIFGSEGYTSTCSSCHGGRTGGPNPPYTGTAAWTGSTSLALGASASYTFKVNGSDAVENGVALSVRTSGTTALQGTFTVGSGLRTDSPTFLTQSSPQVAGFSWDFTWQAPATEGTYTMYGCINQVNGDNSTTLDGPPVCSTRAITVSNTVPVAVNDTRLTDANLDVGENDGASASFNVLSNDNDGDAGVVQTLSVQSINTSGTIGLIGGTAPNYTYNPNGQFESLAAGATTTDSFTYTLSDGIDTAVGTVTVTINGVNDTPSVSVNGNPGYQEGDPPVTLDSVITVSDVDTTDQINRARVVISNYQSGEDVLACAGTLGSGSLTGITSCGFSAGTLTLLGTTSRANYANALESVTYENTSLNPTVGDRNVTFDVRDDNSSTSATGFVTVSVSSLSTPPTITGFSGTAMFVEGAVVAVDTGISISDPDSLVGSELNRATMTLTTNYDSAEDLLVCPAALSLPSGISCLYSAPVLSLSSGTSNSLAEYATAIQLVAYNNTSDNPGINDRTVTLTARDTNLTVSTPVVSKLISVTAVNDLPTLTSTATTIATENSVYSYTPSVNDPDDVAPFIFTISGEPVGGSFSTSTGVFSWTPPRTNTFNDAITTFTITVEDGDEDISTPDSEDIGLVVSPPDSDGDGIADYSDNCPTIANAGQADLDGDTVHILPQTDPSGIPVDGDVDPTATDAANALGESYQKGGDVCDEDVDGDGISKTFEDATGFLSDTDASDAALDQDGDGVSNLQEFLDGTDPTLDTVGPTVTAPADVTVDATGFLTSVDIGVATANDGNDGTINVVIPVVDGAITCAQLGSTPDTIDPLRPGSYTITWHSCDSGSNLSTADQLVTVLPLITTTSGQIIGEGQVATFAVFLNGDAPNYPVFIDYVLTGSTATSIDDYDALSGTISITSGRVGTLDINIVNDALTEADETIVLTLQNPVNAALGELNVHTVTITEANIAPLAILSVTQPMAIQDIIKSNVLYQPDGIVRIIAIANDGNGDALTFDWSASDSNLLAIAVISSNQIDFDPNTLTAGSLYKVSVVVSDGISSVTVERLLQVLAGEVNGWVIGQDDDGDGLDNLSEGYGDADADGIPDYLDNVFLAPNVINNQTGDLGNSFIIETDPGLNIRKGTTAIAAGVNGVLISQSQLEANGGEAGGVVVNAVDSNTNTSGFYDFEISGLNPSIVAANVVIPLPSAIQPNSVYRKYNTIDGWFTFVEDDNNAVRSAQGELGVCPAPGSSEYTQGLTVFHYCVQLTIEDGGPNDADKTRDFVIRDPGGVAVQPEVVETKSPSDGRIGVMHPLVLLMMLLPFAYVYRKQIRRK